MVKEIEMSIQCIYNKTAINSSDEKCCKLFGIRATLLRMKLHGMNVCNVKLMPNNSMKMYLPSFRLMAINRTR